MLIEILNNLVELRFEFVLIVKSEKKKDFAEL